MKEEITKPGDKAFIWEAHLCFPFSAPDTSDHTSWWLCFAGEGTFPLCCSGCRLSTSHSCFSNSFPAIWQGAVCAMSGLYFVGMPWDSVREFLFSVVASHPELCSTLWLSLLVLEVLPVSGAAAPFSGWEKLFVNECQWVPTLGIQTCSAENAQHQPAEEGWKVRAAEFTAGHCFHFWQQHARNQQRWFRKLHLLKEGKKIKGSGVIA